ncbi:MAG: TolC family protein [Planctomycetota bacterium]|nr:TolC family protein [Planctomycetota bacterium]
MPALLLAGCASYTPKPLAPEDVVARAALTRAQPDAEGPAPAGPVTFVQAARWMLAHGPEVREAVAAYETSLARAGRKTPLPNPGLEIGPQFGFGPDQGPVNAWSPFGSIGFTIPLGKRLRRQDELNRALADVARVEALVRHREIYLELRGRYSELALARRREAERAEIVASARKAALAARKLVEAGQATALDVALFDLDLMQVEAESLEARRETARAGAGLARAVGVRADLFAALPAGALPVLPASIPGEEELKTQLVAHHPELARLRARYEAAERELRLEIARQWPDFTFGPSFDSESGEKRTVVGLTLGLEIPFFDRNEQGIAEAERRREEVRVRYEAAANRALAGLEAARADLELARSMAALVRDTMAPRAARNIELAQRAVEAGAGDVLKLLDAERSHRAVRLRALEADLAERAAWVALESAVGQPLLRFPGEEADVEAPPGLGGAESAQDGADEDEMPYLNDGEEPGE